MIVYFWVTGCAHAASISLLIGAFVYVQHADAWKGWHA